MRIKLGSFVTDMSGKLGGTHIQRNNGILTMGRKRGQKTKSIRNRAWPRPVMSIVAAAWRRLTVGQRIVWFNFAQTYRKPDGSFPSPYELFFAVNSIYAASANALVTSISVRPEQVIFTNLNIICQPFPPSLLYNRIVPVGYNCTCFLFVSRSGKYKDSPQLKQFSYYGLAPASGNNLVSIYTRNTTYGLPQYNPYDFVAFKFVFDNAGNPWQRKEVILVRQLLP